jgi:SAM-dependent methyltransferase
MPACVQCHMLIGNQCSAYAIAEKAQGRKISPPPLGPCHIPIVEGYLSSVKEGMRVLEVGCGAWDRIKSYCEEVGAHYEGIDAETEYLGRKTVATRTENLAELSFPDEYFDWVIGIQTMEHWADNGCSLRWGLYQCFRVTKPGGRVCMNVPIHFHGDPVFLFGDFEVLRNLFAPFSSQVSFENWGHPSGPISSWTKYPGYRRLCDKPAYNLDIQAIKDSPLPIGYSNRGARSGLLAHALNYPFSFNVYRALHMAGLVRRGIKYIDA